MRAPESKSLASCLLTLSVRPLMPPAALHHFTNASATWKNSISRPGTIVLPASDMVPRVIVLPLIPRPEPPVPLPGPQMPFSVPKSPADEALEDDEAAPDELLLVFSGVSEPPDRLHAAAPLRSTTLADAAANNRRVECRARSFERSGSRAVRNAASVGRGLM